MAALTSEKSKGPRRGLYVKLKKKWLEICEKVNEEKNLCKMDWQRDDETPQLCVLYLGDKEVPAKTKLQALIEFEEPDEFQSC